MKYKYPPLGNPPSKSTHTKKIKSGEKRFMAVGGAIVVAASTI